MRRVAVAVLEKNVAEYVRAAEAGETVLVTENDRVVAELRPPERRAALTDDEFIAMGVREGWLRPAEVSFREPLPEREVPDGEVSVSFEQLMADLERDREDR